MLSAFGLICLQYSCKPDGPVELRPSQSAFPANALYVDTFSVTSYTVKVDSLRSDGLSQNLLGSYVDPVFGKSTASFYTQFSLPVVGVNFGNPSELVVDSIILSLDHELFYGKNDAQNFRVFEVTKNILEDSALLYSNQNIEYNTTSIGDLNNYTPALADTQMRIPLNSFWARKFLDAPATTYSDNTAFKNYFKGLYVSVNNASQPSGEGAIYYFNLLSDLSKLTLYYKNVSTTATFTQDFVITNNEARVNHFTHDYTGTPVAAQFTNSSSGQDFIYVQSMAGVKSKVLFTGLKNFLDQNDNSILINKAEVVLPVDESNTGFSDYPPHEKLILLAADSLGNQNLIIDQLEGSAYYGGIYDKSAKEYRFNIARHISLLSANNLPDFGFYIVAGAGAVNANRTVLKGGNNIKLQITYTKIE